ncbi:cell envelope biogenesis protein OmpA [Streptomyces antibioticus]|uniref:cell envelope biogenesis protein OmpA n=1 Tax=Streptomyces antibioticus TaxID=1890 RepID=UPI0036C4FE6C
MHAIPQRCARRPLAGGLVVPYVTLVHGGHAAFGTLDADKTINAFRRRLCQICGQPLDERCYLLVRPADVVKECSPEPALHPECLPYTAEHCPMLNGSRTHYRRSPVLASHPAGRPCTDPSCPCPDRSPDDGHSARSGSPADRYEAWMIHTVNYRLVPTPGRPDVPCGISVRVPALRKRLLRTATLTPRQQHLLDLWNALMNGS